jgi:hypothetical protein
MRRRGRGRCELLARPALRGTDLNQIIRAEVYTIPEAILALEDMGRQLTAAKTFDVIKKVEQYTQALKVLFAHVDEVKHKAQDTIIAAHQRIGEELKKVPKAHQRQQSPK